MSDLPVEGARAHPLRMGMGQRIVEVHFGGGIGVLTVDAPDGVRLSFKIANADGTDPSEADAANMASKTAGDIIERKDFARFDDGTGPKPAPVSLLITDPMILKTLYGEGAKHWGVGAMMRSPGPDPGKHVMPSSFAPGGLVPNVFPNPDWVDYSKNYKDQKDKFTKEGSRWIEVGDLLGLGKDTLTSGLPQRLFGPGETWKDLHYGSIQTFFYQLVPYEPPRFTFGGAPQFQTIYNPGDIVPGNIGYAPQFDIFEQQRIAPWGLGENVVNGNPGRKAVRHIYFLDFQVVKDKKVTVKSAGERADPQIPGGVEIRLQLELFGGSTKFTLMPMEVKGDKPATFGPLAKSFPYTQSGELIYIDRKGFVV